MTTSCSFEGCQRKHYAKGHCSGHYSQLRTGKSLSPIRSMKGGPKVPVTYRDSGGRKRCSTCREWLNEGEFGKNSALTDGLANSCKECQWGNGVWSKYRITGSQYMDILALQGGGCAVCGSPDSEGRRLAVDHDHACCPGSRSCGQCVRGLLCIDCNTAIGSLKDDVSLLRKAIAYLEGQ